MSYLLFYLPLCLVVLTVMEVCRESKPAMVARRVAKNFLLLSGLFLVGSAAVLLLQRFL